MGIVIHDIVDALELFLLNNLILLNVVNLQATHLRIVRCIDETLSFAVEGYKSWVIELDAVDIFQFLLLTSLQVDLRQVCEATRGVHGGIGLSCIWVIDKG